MVLDKSINTINLDINSAKEILNHNGLTDINVYYKDSKKGHGKVVDQRIRRDGSVDLFIGTRSIINNLPGNYQRNESLKNFLMIFQHFNNDFDHNLDNLYNTFNPMKTRKEFLLWLSSWFSLDIGTELPEMRYRRLVREIVSLYRWRGTKYGLERMLEVISGHRPEIIEGYRHEILDDNESVSFMFSELGDRDTGIGIIFPVTQKELGGSVVKTIFNIVEKEKPAHLSCRILFKSTKEETVKNKFTIGDITMFEDTRL